MPLRWNWVREQSVARVFDPLYRGFFVVFFAGLFAAALRRLASSAKRAQGRIASGESIASSGGVQ